jgi:hypothetical protein
LCCIVEGKKVETPSVKTDSNGSATASGKKEAGKSGRNNREPPPSQQQPLHAATTVPAKSADKSDKRKEVVAAKTAAPSHATSSGDAPLSDGEKQVPFHLIHPVPLTPPILTNNSN